MAFEVYQLIFDLFMIGISLGKQPAKEFISVC
jgi:hypothetical protein